MHDKAENAETIKGHGVAPETVFGLPAWAVTALAPLVVGLLGTTLALAGTPLNRVVIGGATRFGRSAGLWLFLPAALGVMLIAAAGVGLLRGLARWSYPWAYAVLVMVAMALVVLADDRPALVSPLMDGVLGLALLAAMGAVALVAARRSWIDALVAGLGFGAAFLLFNFSAVAVAPFHRVDLALLALPASLVFGGLIAAVARDGAVARWLAALVTAILAAGLMWLYTYGISGHSDWAPSLFAIRVVQVALIGLLGPLALAWLLRVRKPTSGVLANR
jgi:hypothetical protein